MRRVAVILTGALRTIRRTIRFLKRNVLYVAGDQVQVFACLQNDTSISEDEWNAWFDTQIGGYLQPIEWIPKEGTAEWTAVRDRLLTGPLQGVSEQWRHYLQHSGSMIEYHQLYLAYLHMCTFEAVHRMRFDWLIRARTDSIFTQPVDFRWLGWSDHGIEERMDVLRAYLSKDATAAERLDAMMSTLMSDKVIPNFPRILRDPRIAAGTPIPETPAEMNRYIREGRYILTLRKNNLYVVRRDLFYLIPSLATLYGTFRSPNADDYWFNAEGQFRDACEYAGLSVFDYSTVHEERSLDYPATWQNALFFDEAGEPRTDPPMLYVIVRREE